MFIITAKLKTSVWYFRHGTYDIWISLPHEATLFPTKIMGRIALKRVIDEGEYTNISYGDYSFSVVKIKL